MCCVICLILGALVTLPLPFPHSQRLAAPRLPGSLAGAWYAGLVQRHETSGLVPVGLS
ncbi:hypothetical protein EXIGLDRAFT_735115 [Exidia glandulosa HHB12029]|uniref:Uncharacterized protein n=1 Tax=Exidia glandulosa HHB12029 TaxID=1314781 RepID=A0A166AVJ7_EXIGL|nr:hypothetical protein EXIGLDRAFT_735115 [Exidia glandulosa HHB12029]